MSAGVAVLLVGLVLILVGHLFIGLLLCGLVIVATVAAGIGR